MSTSVVQLQARFLRSGLVAGAISALVFAGLHDLLISDIWFSAVPMMVAGGVCGGSVGYTYGLVSERPSLGSWIRYVLSYLVVLGVLGVASVVVFEPVTTVATLIEANEPPTELFGKAMPMTIGVLLVMTSLVGGGFGRTWQHYVAVFVTCSILVALLGLNVSVIGLVDVPRGSMCLIVELFALIVMLGAVYALGVVVIERRLMGVSPR